MAKIIEVKKAVEKGDWHTKVRCEPLPVHPILDVQEAGHTDFREVRGLDTLTLWVNRSCCDVLRVPGIVIWATPFLAKDGVKERKLVKALGLLDDWHSDTDVLPCKAVRVDCFHLN